MKIVLKALSCNCGFNNYIVVLEIVIPISLCASHTNSQTKFSAITHCVWVWFEITSGRAYEFWSEMTCTLNNKSENYLHLLCPNQTVTWQKRFESSLQSLPITVKKFCQFFSGTNLPKHFLFSKKFTTNPLMRKFSQIDSIHKQNITVCLNAIKHHKLNKQLI